MEFYHQKQEREVRVWRIMFIISFLINLAVGGYLLYSHMKSSKVSIPSTPGQESAATVKSSGEPVISDTAGTAAAPSSTTSPADKDGGTFVAETPQEPTVPGLKTFCHKVTQSLYATFRDALPETEAEWLSAYFTRVMAWNMNMQKDVQKGDEVRVIYQMDGLPETMVVPAMEYKSTSGKYVKAVRYKAPGDAFPRYFDETGAEIELRLKDSPIHDWEQITELFAGPRRHHGMDFKAPIGTPIYAPFNGTVVRKNWNWRANGNCLELAFPGKPFHAFFLHMDRISRDIGAGTEVKAGEEIGRVGNTGHVTAPHLHYQLEVNDRPVDPMKMHTTYRRFLKAEEKPAFIEATRDLLKQLDTLKCE